MLIIFFQIFISTLEASSASLFKEKNLFNFFKIFNNLCEKYMIDIIKRLLKVYKYYKKCIYKYI